MKHTESTAKFIKRKLTDAGSILYRHLGYPFVKMYTERKYDSIICKGSYLRCGCTLEGRVYISENCQLSNVHLGYGSLIGRDSTASNIQIGRYSCIGSFQTLLGQHPVHSENISIHPAFYSTAAQYGYTYVKENHFTEATWLNEDKHIQIMIGNDVWAGYNISYLEGVTVGDGAVIGSGSLVTKDIEPYAIYAGVPAKKIGMRFDNDTIEKLLRLKWWDKDSEWISKNAEQFSSPDDFIQEHCK